MKMKPKICVECRESFIDNSEDESQSFCSEECEIRSRRDPFTTMSITHKAKAMLKVLQNEIYQTSYRKPPSLSVLVEQVFELTQKLLGNRKLSDRLIDEYKYKL